MKFAACFALVALGAQGLRRGRKTPAGTKFILGDIPILNYDRAYKNNKIQASLAESSMEEDWVIVMKPEVTDDQIHELCSLGKCLAEGHPDEGGMPYFEVRASESDLETLLSRSNKAGFIKFVEPDDTFDREPEIMANPASDTWGLTRIGTSERSSRGAGTHIYVLDTGIRKTHSDFGGRVIPTLDKSRKLNQRCVSWSPLPCADDKDGHGTHCAGTAGGATYGVASEASLHAVKVLDDDGSGSYSWSYDALDFIATKGMRPAVASLSLGGYGKLEAFKTAVDTAVEAGVIVIVAGGNSNWDACRFSPAYVPSAITVGSTTSEDAKSSFSNHGECVDIWAPGSDILSAGVASDDASDTFSGTSMACPHVSGAAALLLERDPNMNSAKVLAKLQANAVLNGIEGLKRGDTNALLYVGAGGPPPTPVPTPAPTRTTCDEATSERKGNVCWCNWPLRCFEDGSKGCKVGSAWIYNQHRVNCPLCACLPDE